MSIGPVEWYAVDVQVDDAFLLLVDEAALVAAVETTLRRCEVPQAALTIVVTDDDEVQTLNRTYLGIDEPTDVLSFPAQEEVPSAPPLHLPPELSAALGRYLGDLVIALPTTQRQAEQMGRSLTAELKLLAVHGTLHLLGYDHATAAEESVMWALQETVLAALDDGESQGRRRSAQPR